MSGYGGERIPIDELAQMETEATGQAKNLKLDTGKYRYWLSRCGVSDGATYAASIEELQDGRWVTIDQYGEPFER